MPSSSKVLRTTKVTAPAPVRLRRSPSSATAAASNNNNNNGNSSYNLNNNNCNPVKPSLNPNRASYPAAVLPTVTENRSLDNRFLLSAGSIHPGGGASAEEVVTSQKSEICDLTKAGSSRLLADLSSASGSNSSDRLSGTDGTSCTA